MIETLYNAFNSRLMIWWRGKPIAREEFALALGLGLAPLLAIKDLLHPDESVFTSATVTFIVTAIGVAIAGAISALLVENRSPICLDKMLKFSGAYVQVNLFLGVIFLLQRMEFTPDYWSPVSPLLFEPTPIQYRALYNASCLFLPILLTGMISIAAIQSRCRPIKERFGQKYSNLISKQYKFALLVLLINFVLGLILLEILLWHKLPDWLSPAGL